uniref:Cyclin n=1 Tax=Oryza punctata TaxID=4537 RepID=A0A0E0KTM7_ORYPU
MASTELASDVYALPCGDDGTTALSTPVVVSVLASLLERHIARNERDQAGRREAAADGEAARRARAFDSGTVLDMSLHAFLERFSRYAHVSPQVYVVAYAYLDRLRRGDGAGAGVRVVSVNAQRLLTTAILVASKFVEDRNYKNSYFAAVGGLTVAELSSLELDFLFLMQFRLNVSVSVFQTYCRHLEREDRSKNWAMQLFLSTSIGKRTDAWTGNYVDCMMSLSGE